MNTKYFDSLLEACFVLNANGEITYANPTGELLIGQSARKVIRQKEKLTGLLQFTTPPDFLTNPASVTEATPYVECDFLKPDGDSGRVQLSLQRLEVGSGEEWLLFFRDVTLEATLQKKYRKEFEQKEIAFKKLEDYSKNLEVMVQERTRDLAELNHRMRALIDSLSQGFLLIGSDGLVRAGASRSCEVLLNQTPENKPLAQLLGFDDKKTSGLNKWLITAFAEMLPFEDLAPLAPPRVNFKDRGITLDLNYTPVRNPDGGIEAIVVVLTDVSALLAAEQEARIEKKNAELVMHILKKKNQFKIFLSDAKDIVAELNHHHASQQQNKAEVFRLLHTLKGGAASFSIESVTQLCHQAETALHEENWSLLHTLIPAITQAFDQFVNQFASLFFSLDTGEIRELPVQRLHEMMNWLTPHVPEDISQRVELALFGLTPEEAFSGVSESLETLATSLGKGLKPLQFREGARTLLPVDRLQSLLASFVHAFRNSIDHGIENPDLRAQLGKPIEGQITLDFSQVKEDLHIVIEDDGLGISPQAIRSKCQKLGIEHAQESDHQVIQRVFDSAFSLKETVTEISGRGVGMDAIKAEVEKRAGKVEVFSHYPHGGTQIKILLPGVFRSARRLRPTG